MLEMLQKFENKRPELTFEWHDEETGAEGWVVINSLRGGAAGGGTRMRKGLDKREVESLAKTMEIKFTVSGPSIGGAKSGINFDPNDPRKGQVLKKWFAAVKPLLKTYYGTGGDLNVDELHEVIPITEGCGIWHPQEGVLSGHLCPTDAQTIKRIGQLRYGVSKIIENEIYTPELGKKYTVADMITGFGVAESIRHYYNLYGGDITNKKAIIQGWGNVGAAAGFYLTKMGIKIVGIIDREGGVINQEGFTLDEISKFFINRKGNQLQADDLISYEEINNMIWDIDHDIFIPAAASRLLTKDHLERMLVAGLEVISCGANVPFSDNEIFFGPTGVFADKHCSVIPDFIANCGMARVFAYLMSSDVSLNDEDIFNDTSCIIFEAMNKTYNACSAKTDIAATSFKLALNQIN